MYVCMHACMDGRMYVCMYVCVCMYDDVCMYVMYVMYVYDYYIYIYTTQKLVD